MKNHQRPFLFLSLLAGTVLVLDGCMTAIKHGNIVSITQAGVGIDVESVSSSSGSPAVKMGFFRTTVTLVPTSTTGPINSPNVANTASVDQNGKAFTIGGSETLAVGTYQTGSSSNAIQAQPIVAK